MLEEFTAVILHLGYLRTRAVYILEPITEDRIPHRPRTAAEVARVQAQANMKSDYGMFKPSTAGLSMPTSMFDRPMTGARRQRTIIRSPQAPSPKPGGQSPQVGAAKQSVSVEDDKIAVVGSDWSTKLDDKFAARQKPLKNIQKGTSSSQSGKLKIW